MPTRYSETPGGTAFLFTPGGTKIVYERRYLLKLKNSPLSKTPCKLPVIPGVTLDDEGNVIEEEDEAMPTVQETGKSKTPVTREEKPAEPEEALFDMEMLLKKKTKQCQLCRKQEKARLLLHGKKNLRSRKRHYLIWKCDAENRNYWTTVRVGNPKFSMNPPLL